MRRARRRGTALLLVGGVAMATSMVGGLAAYGEGDPGSGLGAFSLSANAPAVQFLEDNDNAQTHPEGEFELPQAVATLSTGPVGYALSSVAWPGNQVGNLGTLLIVASGGQVPDQASALNDPVRAEAHNGNGTVTNTQYPGMSMTATVQRDLTAADGGLDGATSKGVYSVGATDASSVSHLTGTSSAVTTARTRLHDVSIARGVVTIASLTSAATATTDGARAVGKSSTKITGMKIAGVPVEVDSTGVHVGPAGGDVPPQAAGVVRQALAQVGMTLAYSAPTSTRQGGDVDYAAGTLVIMWRPPPPPGQPDTHESITVLLGGATVSAHATRGTAYNPLQLGTTGGSGPAPGAGQPSAATGGQSGGLPAADQRNVAPAETTGNQAPEVASVSASPVTNSGPSLPGELPAAWVLLGVFGAAAFGIGVLRRVPAIGALTTACPREIAL